MNQTRAELDAWRIRARRLQREVERARDIFARLTEERDAAQHAADAYAGDLRAIVERMNAHGYPNHPEYPDDDQIIRRIGEMAARVHRVTEERDALLEVVRDAGKHGSGYAYRQRAEQIAAEADKAKGAT